MRSTVIMLAVSEGEDLRATVHLRVPWNASYHSPKSVIFVRNLYEFCRRLGAEDLDSGGEDRLEEMARAAAGSEIKEPVIQWFEPGEMTLDYANGFAKASGAGLLLWYDAKDGSVNVCQHAIRDVALRLPRDWGDLPKDIDWDIFAYAHRVGYGLGTVKEELRREFRAPWRALARCLQKRDPVLAMEDLVARDILYETVWVETVEQAEELQEDGRPRSNGLTLAAYVRSQRKLDLLGSLYFHLDKDAVYISSSGTTAKPAPPRLLLPIRSLPKDAGVLAVEETGRAAVVAFIRANWELERTHRTERMVEFAHLMGEISYFWDWTQDGPPLHLLPGAGIGGWYLLDKLKRMAGPAGGPLLEALAPGVNGRDLEEALRQDMQDIGPLTGISAGLEEVAVRRDGEWWPDSYAHLRLEASGALVAIEEMCGYAEEAASVHQPLYAVPLGCDRMLRVTYEVDENGRGCFLREDGTMLVSLHDLRDSEEDWNIRGSWKGGETVLRSWGRHCMSLAVLTDQLEAQEGKLALERLRTKLRGNITGPEAEALRCLSVPEGWAYTLAQFEDGALGVAYGPRMEGEETMDAMERLCREAAGTGSGAALYLF